MFRFASLKSMSLHDIHSQTPGQSLSFCCHLTEVSQSSGLAAVLCFFVIVPGLCETLTGELGLEQQASHGTVEEGRKNSVLFLSCSVGL